MKSKRADRAIMDLSQEAGDFGIDTAVVLIDDARKAVELAEEDARERAIMAFCKHCKTTRNPARCDGVTYCPIADNYIKHYENE